MERVIFRTERDPYTKDTNYIAVFPDDKAKPGRYAFVAFKLNESGAVFEPYDELDSRYYYANTKIVHKSDEIIPRLLCALSMYYHTEFEPVERITVKRKV